MKMPSKAAVSLFVTTALLLSSNGCRDRAAASAYDVKDSLSGKGATNYLCSVFGQKALGSQVSGLVGRSKAAGINALTISIPAKENNEGATLGFVSTSKDIESLRVERQAIDLYDRWGRLARVSGGVFDRDDSPIIKVTAWFNTVKADGTGFVEFEEGKPDDAVKVIADFNCRD